MSLALVTWGDGGGGVAMESDKEKHEGGGVKKMAFKRTFFFNKP